MRNNNTLKLGLVCLCLTLVFACKRDLDTNWDTEYATPIAFADMDLTDLVEDSLIVKKGDHSLDLVYDYRLAVDSIDKYLEVPDTLQEKSITLNKLVLDNRALSDTITLGEIYPLSRLLNGQTMDLQAFDQTSNQGTDIDITKQFFKQAKFKEGFIDMVLSNDLPVEAEKIVFQLINKLDNQIIIYDSFLNVLPNTSVKSTKSLAGKKIDGILTGIVKRVKTKASSGPVLIESEKGIRLDLSIRDVELEYATAVFPSQNLIEENQEVQYNLGGSQLTYMEIKSGFVVMEVYSNVKEELILDYKIPNSSRNFDKTDIVRQTIKVPPAQPGSYSKVIKKFPLDGYQVSYKGKTPDIPPFKYNTIYSEFTARMEYTGIERTLSLQDSVYVRFGLVEIKPKVAIGDFGKREFKFDKKEPIKIFEGVKGDLSLEDINVYLWFENAFGIEADLTIDNITAVNTRTNKSVQLLSPDLNGTFTLRRATNPPFKPYIHSIIMNKSNSNIKQFVENIPDRLDSKFSLLVRPRGSQDYTDFVFDYSRLTANLRLEMPIQFGSNGLELSQLQNFDLLSMKNSDRIKSGVLKLDVQNGYPIEAVCNIEFLDNAGNVLTTLFDVGAEQTAMPGITDAQGFVNQPTQSQLVAEIPAAKMQIIRNASKIRIKAKFSTAGGSRYKIYDSYKFNVKLKGRFVYEQGF